MTMSHKGAICKASDRLNVDRLPVDEDLDAFIRAYLDARGLVMVDKAIMAAIAEGYRTSVVDDRYVQVVSPKYKEDDGSDPFLVFDLHADPFGGE